MEFKESKEKLKEMLAPRPKVVGGDKLVNYQGMDVYTETLMQTVNKKQDFWSPDLDTTHDTIVGAINEVNDKAWTVQNTPLNKASAANYMKLKNGLIVQFGSINIRIEQVETAVTLPISFENGSSYCVAFSRRYNVSPPDEITNTIENIDGGKFLIRQKWTQSRSGVNGYSWIAIGR